MKKNMFTKYLWRVLALIIVAGAVLFVVQQVRKPGPQDALAQCLQDSGAKFYGAFWCPHCQNQKKMFGKSQKLLPYVECSTPNGQGQKQVCTDAGIMSYPTWEFADGSRLNGEIPLATLAEKAQCAVPTAQ